METKRVTIVRSGGTASVEVELMPGETAEQVCTIAAPQLGLPADGAFKLFGPDANQITGDVYKTAKPGDKLTMMPLERGG